MPLCSPDRLELDRLSPLFRSGYFCALVCVAGSIPNVLLIVL